GVGDGGGKEAPRADRFYCTPCRAHWTNPSDDREVGELQEGRARVVVGVGSRAVPVAARDGWGGRGVRRAGATVREARPGSGGAAGRAGGAPACAPSSLARCPLGGR